MSNKQGNFVPRAVLFVSNDENLILILLCKENLENKKISASDWLKSNIFMFYIPDLGLCYRKPIYSSSVDNLEEH